MLVQYLKAEVANMQLVRAGGGGVFGRLRTAVNLSIKARFV